MSLLHPEFLLALTALAVPIIIHLFNFRRFKRVVFPNVRFLKEVDLKTRSKNRLKHLLVLLSRLLAVAALVFAFARPFIPANDNEKAVKTRHIAVYVDNSFSMNLENDAGNLLAQGMKMAEKIADSYGPNDRFLLLTNDFKAEHQRLLSIDEFKEAVASVSESPATRKYSEIYERASDALGRFDGEARTLFYISDLQERSFDPVNASPDTLMNAKILQLEHAGQGNVYVDSLWFESPVRSTHNPERIGVRVVNSSGKDLYDIPVRLTIDGVQKALGTMTLKPFSTVDSVLTYTNANTGWQSGAVSIKDHPIIFDDVLNFAYEVDEKCNIAILGPTDTRIKVARVFGKDPFYEVSESELRQVDVSSFLEKDLIVLAGVNAVSTGITRELSKFVFEGGSICYIPGTEVDQNSINEFLLAIQAQTISNIRSREMKVSDIDVDHALFQDVFDQTPRNMNLPKAQRYLSFNSRVQSVEERVMSLQDGNAFLSAYPIGKGRSYIFATGLDASLSDLGAHSIFITSLLRMAEISGGTPRIYQEIGSDQPAELRLGQRTADAVYSIASADDTFSFIPEQRTQGSQTLLFDRGQIRDAGIYYVKSDAEEKATIAYNYNRQESEMEFVSQEEALADLQRNGILDASFVDVATMQTGNFSAAVAGSPLWRYFIIAALIFLAIEVLLLKFWK
jgi:hypothetical protein